MKTIEELFVTLQGLPKDMQNEAIQYIEGLERKAAKKREGKVYNHNHGDFSKRKSGLAKGLITIADDFDEPLEDFEEYM